MASTIIPPVPEEEKKKPFWEREGYKSIMNSGAKLPSSSPSPPNPIIAPVKPEDKSKPFWDREGYKPIMNSGAKLPSSTSIMPLVKPEDKSKPFWDREGYKPIMNSGAKLPSSVSKSATTPMKDLFSSAFEQINSDEEKRKKNPWAFV